ncbi:LysR family transcriptional regulator [Hydrogenoanaerobacterium sp.]|uniref:LysR family transcriptional regulator n=1 Tax=Hydrogenoanaerobacterium sp. TaxID=2953763 RepID=UPI00289D6E66|nr:LysR family transcriptional regulator [Hydrogenoanaerobacterium sp.]
MFINLELYRVFREVAGSGSFSQAARSLFITQSAVSQSVQQLERQLGRKLFTRSRRGVTLTPEGTMLYEHVSSALSIIASGEEKLERMRHLQAGELSIGAGDTISEHYLLPYLEQFHNLYPEIRLKVINRTSGQALALLKSGSIDLAFANLPLDEPDITVRKCMEVNDVFVASDKFSHFKGRTLESWELAQCHLIMLERLSNSRRFVDNFFLQNGVQLEPEIELGAHDLLLEFARIGLGISCVIEEFSTEYLQSGELFLLKLKKPVPPRSIGLCSLAGVSPSFAAERFMQLLPAVP